MKKNKSYIFIILLTAVLIFSVAWSCNWCEPVDPNYASDNTTSTTAKVKSTSNLIHGVEPTVAIGHIKDKDDGINYGTLQFWNVGKLGGEQLSKATFTVTGETYEGDFSGGPNGELFINANGKIIQGKLVDGKGFVNGDGDTIEIENPEVFDGWKGDAVEEAAAESTEAEETTAEEEITTQDETVGLTLTNNDLAGTYTATVTDSTGYTFKSGYTIIPSGSDGGTFDGNPYTFSGDTLTYSVDGPDQKSNGSFKFTKSGDTITAEGTAEGVLIEENGTETQWSYIITMQKN